MKQTNEPMITLTDTNTTTKQMITPEMKAQLEQLECWRRDQKWTEEVMHGLAANGGADQSRLFFEQVMYTVRQSAPENLVRFMNTYIRGLKDGVHVEDSLEYAVTFQQAELLAEMLERYEDDDTWQEWVRVYLFLLEGLEGKLTYEEVLLEAEDLACHVTDVVLELRLILAEAVAYRHLGKHAEFNAILERIQKDISKLEISFMKNSLESRAALGEANFLLYTKGNMDEAELKLLNVVANNATPCVMLVFARHSLGLTTLRKSKEICLGHYQQAISHAKQAGLDGYERELTSNYYPFARNVHGEHFDLTDVVPEEKIHQYIVRGERKKALQLIDQLEADGEGSTFLTFYRGKATGDRQLLEQAWEQFKKDHYGYMLPLIEQELIKMGAMQK